MCAYLSAKAGAQSLSLARTGSKRLTALDSRLRGNDGMGCAGRGLEGCCEHASSKWPVRQYQHLAVAAALLSTDQRRLDVFDRVVRIDRCFQHAVADLARQIGIDFT